MQNAKGQGNESKKKISLPHAKCEWGQWKSETKINKKTPHTRGGAWELIIHPHHIIPLPHCIILSLHCVVPPHHVIVSFSTSGLLGLCWC